MCAFGVQMGLLARIHAIRRGGRGMDVESFIGKHLFLRSSSHSSGMRDARFRSQQAGAIDKHYGFLNGPVDEMGIIQ